MSMNQNEKKGSQVELKTSSKNYDDLSLNEKISGINAIAEKEGILINYYRGAKKLPDIGKYIEGAEGAIQMSMAEQEAIKEYIKKPLTKMFINWMTELGGWRKKLNRKAFINRATEYGKQTNSPVATIDKLIDLYDESSDKVKEILNKELVKSLRKLKKKRKKYSPEVVEEVNTAHRDFMKIFVGGNTKIDKAVEDGTMQKGSKEYNKAKKEVLIGSLEHLYKGQKIAKKNKWESADKYFTDAIIELDDDLQKLIVDGEKTVYNKEKEYTYKDGGDKKFGMSTDEELDWVNDKLDNAYFEGADIKNRLENKFYENDESKKNDEKLLAKNLKQVHSLQERKKVLEARKEKAGNSQTTSSSGSVGTSSASGQTGAASGVTVGTSGKSASGNVIPTSKEAVQAPGVATVDGKASDTQKPKTGAAAQTGMGGDKCSCCVELKAIRSFLENSKLSRTDKEKAGKKLDEFETIVTTEDSSEVSAVGGNIAPEAIEMSAGKMTEFTVPVEKINSSPVYAVDGALKPFPAATGGMTVEQDMVYRKDGDYRDYTMINGKPLNTFNPDVAKRHFPSSLKSAKNEIEDAFRDKMNQPLNVAAAPVGTAGIDDVRAQMTRVKEAPNPGENMQAVLNRMGQTLKHIDTVLNNRLPGDNF